MNESCGHPKCTPRKALCYNAPVGPASHEWGTA